MLEVLRPAPSFLNLARMAKLAVFYFLKMLKQGASRCLSVSLADSDVDADADAGEDADADAAVV